MNRSLNDRDMIALVHQGLAYAYDGGIFNLPRYTYVLSVNTCMTPLILFKCLQQVLSSFASGFTSIPAGELAQEVKFAWIMVRCTGGMLRK